MTKERIFKKSYAAQLFRIAQSDYETAEALRKAQLSRKENIFFHYQQTVEKALKAVLVKRGKPVPLVHELAIITDRFEVGDNVPFASILSDWTQFATIRRYEEGQAILTDEETSGMSRAAQEILDWCQIELSKP